MKVNLKVIHFVINYNIDNRKLEVSDKTIKNC